MLSLRHVAAALAALAATAQGAVYQTSEWVTYPGSDVGFDGTQIKGTLELSVGDSAGDTRLTGTLTGMPLAQPGGIHVHEGFDVSDEDTIGGHYFPGLATDPWNDVEYSTADGDVTINANVPGISHLETLGRVIVVHDETGARVAATQVVPTEPSADNMIYSASLSTYPKYTHLVATLGNYPGSTQGVTGTVWLTEKEGGGLTVTYNLAGLVPGDSEGGIHVHEGWGKDVCDDAANTMGHYWAPADAADPWVTNYAKEVGATTAVGSVDVADTGYLLGGNEYHAMVIHKADGGRIGCGVLHSVAKATVGDYPGTSSGVTGTVWVAQGSTTDKPNDLVLSYELNGLPMDETMGGLHFHTGKTCETAGGHFWTPESEPDPWDNFNTTWMKTAGTAQASGMFAVNSGYDLAENGDHSIVIHAADGSRIGCGLFEYYPSARGYVVLSGALKVTGNLGGVMFQEGVTGGIHVHEGTSCTDITGPNSPGDHLMNSDGSDPWTTTFTVGKTVSKPPGGVDYMKATRMSGEAHVDVSVTGDMQTLEVAKGKTIVVHSANGHRVACGMIKATQENTDADGATSAAYTCSAWSALPLLLVLACTFSA